MTIQISGINCEACTKLIKKRLLNLSGVQDVQVALNGQTQITADREVGLAEIKHALIDTPYTL